MWLQYDNCTTLLNGTGHRDDPDLRIFWCHGHASFLMRVLGRTIRGATPSKRVRTDPEVTFRMFLSNMAAVGAHSLQWSMEIRCSPACCPARTAIFHITRAATYRAGTALKASNKNLNAGLGTSLATTCDEANPKPNWMLNSYKYFTKWNKQWRFSMTNYFSLILVVVWWP